MRLDHEPTAPIRSFLPFAALATCAALAGCGAADEATLDPAGQTTSASALSATVPTYDELALGVTETDSAAPLSAKAAPVEEAAQGACHPHLFSRTSDVLRALNGLSYKFLFHTGDLLAANPSATSSRGHVWGGRRGGLQRQLTVNRNADGSASFELDFALPAAGSSTPAWVKVASGTVQYTAGNASSTPPVAAEKKGTVDFDFSALHGLQPAEPATGQVTFAFDHLRDPSRPAPGRKQVIDMTFHGFKFGPLDPHGARDGSYHWVAEPRVGGSFSFQDSLALLCPSNPTSQVADTVTEARWFVAADGSVHGRVDAKAQNAQGSTWLPADRTWLGVTCHEGPSPTAANESGYWMMKLEDGTGATIQGSEAASLSASSTGSCDPLLGATLPSLSSSSTDWTFGAPLTFPGKW